MAVDEKYVETVGEEKVESNSKENLNLLKEWGIEAHNQPISDNGIELWEYDAKKVSQLPVGDVFIGKPVLGNIVNSSFEKKDKFTGEITTEETSKIELILLDNDLMEAYIFHANLTNFKCENEIVENVGEGSGLYKIVSGIMEIESPGISQYYNFYDKVDLKLLRKKIERLDHLNIKVVEDSFPTTDKKTGEKKTTWYNSFRIISDKAAEELD